MDWIKDVCSKAMESNNAEGKQSETNKESENVDEYDAYKANRKYLTEILIYGESKLFQDTLARIESWFPIDTIDEKGKTILMDAAKFGRVEDIEVIIKAGAKLNLQCFDLCTALHYACYYGHNNACECLISYGIDASLKNIFNETPYDSAYISNHFSTAELCYDKNQSKKFSQLILLSKLEASPIIVYKEGTTYVDLISFHIGRKSDCDFVLKDLSVSKNHCKIEGSSLNDLWMKDLGSTHGTFINDKRLSAEKESSERHQLNIGDRIKIGRLEFTLHVESVKSQMSYTKEGAGGATKRYREQDNYSTTRSNESIATEEFEIMVKTDFELNPAIKKKLLKETLLNNNKKNNNSYENYLNNKKRRRIPFKEESSRFDDDNDNIVKMDPSTDENISYRDRAEERRLRVHHDSIEIAGFDVSNDLKTGVGGKLLEKYGWKEGQGIGINLNGIIEPIKLKDNHNCAGLGL